MKSTNGNEQRNEYRRRKKNLYTVYLNSNEETSTYNLTGNKFNKSEI